MTDSIPQSDPSAQDSAGLRAQDRAGLARETARRRTFAIISHPDAGKTTLTEKLLLYSGLIRTAGMVKGRKGKLATSDWMGMEQERGISITSSAMQFPYKGTVINVLDTPGHQDFSEDTYRTLTAADSAIMVLDAAKGVETQTRKLFEVCRIRKIPVLTFVNKLDLPGRDPLDLMHEVEEVLGIHSSPLNWPIGQGRDFAGVIERRFDGGGLGDVLLFTKTAAAGAQKAEVERLAFGDPRLAESVPPHVLERARHELELLDVAGNPFSRAAFLKGEVTPVFFGSALTNFGVEPFFDAFAELAPSPSARPIDLPDGSERTLDPIAEPFSGYVFKIQANMDKRHRDCLAFVRVCSGRFERDQLVHHHRLDRDIRLSRPHSMVAQERNTVDSAFPGDIVGLINRGTFRIGDTISLRGGFEHKPLPHFQPEVFARIAPKDLGKRKAFDKGLEQLIAEGAVQRLHTEDRSNSDPLLAAVGKLQFEVLEYRLRDEYGVDTRLTPLPYECSAWLEGDPTTFVEPTTSLLTRDSRGRVVVLFMTEWEKQSAARRNPNHKLVDIA
ncbi:MAG: peptide chain release factor 3 [Planctomycetes bacterium]|nr:peptide chain release factor 3 [Planctomycetota bacterium]